MGRAPCCDKANVKKGPWSPEEDAKLKHFIQTNGTGGNWITLPTKAGLRRCGKSCRLRWINYLRPDIKHGSFTEEEEKLIIELHGKVGSRWSLIAAQLQGRTDNDIKNYWNTRLKKKLAEKGMNSSLCHQQQQQQHRSYHMRSAAVPMFAVGLSQADAIRQSQMSKDQLMDHRTTQYLEQQRYNAATQLAIQQGRPASLFSHGQHLEQWQQQQQMLPVKNELPPDHVSEAERFRTIQSELMDILSPEVSNAMTSTLGSTQSVDILHQQSPNSPCSNWSSDKSYGQLDDSPYGDNFSSICNSYGDPPPLVDAQSRPLLPISTVLSPLPPQQQQQLPNGARSIQKEDSASATSIVSSGRFCGLYGDLGTFSDQASYLSDAVTSSPIDRFVKEEVSTDFSSSDLISSPTTRGFLSGRNWPTSRCGDGLSAAHQVQMLPSQTLDAFSEPLGFIFPNQKYVST